MHKYNVYVIFPIMKHIKLKNFKQIRAAWMKDADFKKSYDALDVEFRLVEALIEYRNKRGLTQKQLAELVGTKQSSIARFESGKYNPTFAFVNKLADALGAKIKVEV